MKNPFIVPVLALMLLSFQTKAQDIKAHAPCCPPSRNQIILTENTYQQTVKTVKFKITGITCAGCSSGIYKALEKVNGVIEHSVEYPGGYCYYSIRCFQNQCGGIKTCHRKNRI